AARITASSTLGDGSLTATFGCDCQIGDAPLRGYLWELGDLGVATTSGPSATFPPGRYHVRLTVLDGNGLTATDSVEVTVTKGGLQPPHCRIGLSPPAGPAPLAVQHRATFGDDDGTVITSAFTFSDGATAAEAEPARTYAQPGRYRTTLKVADDNGLTCEDQVQVAVIGAGGQPPPGFVSAGAATASCGVPYQYSEMGRPLVSGAGPFQFDLVPVPGLALPAGMSVDSNTGAINWTPSSRNAGVSRVVLRATSPDGVAEQPLDITVTCAETTTTSVGCTCSQAGGASWIALVAGLALLARARRRQWRRGRAG
ncbi:MAG TPA: PKD domain-containing protein, partial [Myxococcales bacterium]|nr:PKD domain-containing protein [Myxococcales bacterium]